MSLVDDVVAVLKADTGAGGVNTLLTGGIYTYPETGRLGINRDSTPNAYDATTGKIKPCGVVKVRSVVPDGWIADDQAQAISTRAVVELWLYADGDSGFSTLMTVANRAFVVLHGKTIGTSKVIARWVGHPLTDARDEALDAALVRSDYEVRSLA